MLVELGNTKPHHSPGHLATEPDPTKRFETLDDGWHVTEVFVPDSYRHDVGVTLSHAQVARHLMSNLGTGVTRLGSLVDGDDDEMGARCETLLPFIHPTMGLWPTHSTANPSFVSCPDDKDLEGWLATWYDCPAGAPAGKEDNYWTRNGPPGVGPGPFGFPPAGPGAASMLKTQLGYALEAYALGGRAAGFSAASGATISYAATTLTDTAQAWTTNQWVGARVVVAPTGTAPVVGIVVSNTATVITVDRWETPGSPGGTAATTPTATSAYAIGSGNVPAWYIALTANSSAPLTTDTSLAGEITTAGGALVRKISPFSFSGGASTSYTLSPTWTGNASDIYPVTVAKIGVFQSIVTSAVFGLLFATLLSATATLSTPGDQLVLSEVISM
jgi:hypothetical protein